MKIAQIKSLDFPEVKVITAEKFSDGRGYFTETYNKAEFAENINLGSLSTATFIQNNESYSKKNVIRGLHFQWNPYIAKLVRSIEGHMLDLILDIRKNSPTFGKIIAYDMPASAKSNFLEWIWIPVGFAHGNCFLETTRIEYLCTGKWNPKTEAGINPLSPDIDWSLCDKNLRKRFVEISRAQPILSDKDLKGHSVTDWNNNPDSNNFTYSK